MKWTNEEPTESGVYYVQWNPAFVDRGYDLISWTPDWKEYEFPDGSLHPWADAVQRRSSEAITPIGMCNCGRPLYAHIDSQTFEPSGVTHLAPDDEDHHHGFWRNATPKDVIGLDNARALGLEPEPLL